MFVAASFVGLFWLIILAFAEYALYGVYVNAMFGKLREKEDFDEIPIFVPVWRRYFLGVVAGKKNLGLVNLGLDILKWIFTFWAALAPNPILDGISSVLVILTALMSLYLLYVIARKFNALPQVLGAGIIQLAWVSYIEIFHGKIYVIELLEASKNSATNLTPYINAMFIFLLILTVLVGIEILCLKSMSEKDPVKPDHDPGSLSSITSDLSRY